jgi:ADP-ribosylglycohydrolase
VDACRYFGALIVGAIGGTDKATLLSKCYSPIDGYWREHALAPQIAAVASGSFKNQNPPAIRGTGYVVESLEAALWAFYRSESFRDGLLMAVNLGDDADTTGAIYGQLAGAFYGDGEIPRAWRSKLTQGKLIEEFADALCSAAANTKRQS